MANRMSLFYAEATPMLKTLSNATTKFVSEVHVIHSLLTCVYGLVHISKNNIPINNNG